VHVAKGSAIAIFWLDPPDMVYCEDSILPSFGSCVILSERDRLSSWRPGMSIARAVDVTPGAEGFDVRLTDGRRLWVP
jgi:hypothetical protein